VSEAAHLGGDDGEAAAVLSCAGRLDGGVEGEQVRLERDPVDHPGDLADATRRGGDVPHRGDCSRHDVAALLGRAA